MATLIWLCGSSKSGKSTISKLLSERLKRLETLPTIILDGDLLREALIENTFNNVEARKELGFKYLNIGILLLKQNYNVIIAAIGLYHELHKTARKLIPNYRLIHINAEPEILRSRYQKLSLTEEQINDRLMYMSKVSNEIDFDYIVNTSHFTPSESADDIINYLKGYINELK